MPSVTWAMFRRSKRSAVWKISSSGTPYFFTATWNLQGESPHVEQLSGTRLTARCLSPLDVLHELEEKDQEPKLVIEILVPFLFAGCGLTLAGLMLDHVQNWPVFREFPEFFVLVPALLGLKGNLEMTLASRLCSVANLGHLDHPTQGWQTLRSNLALVQFQGIAIGGLASLLPVAIGFCWHGNLTTSKLLLLSSTSIVTASIASFLLGVIMIAVIEGSRKNGINPDNIATPIAASLGDILTLIILAYTASFFLACLRSFPWLLGFVNLGYVFLLPVLFREVAKCEDTLVVFSTGWTPVVASMVISSVGGKVLGYSIRAYPKIATYQPLINGVAGNLVAVQASRVSTWLHAHSYLGQDPTDIEEDEPAHAATARVLFGLVVPGHAFFILVGSVLRGRFEADWLFVGYFLAASLMQVSLLLLLAEKLTNYLWKHQINPDNASIPYLTALGDLLGGVFLTVSKCLRVTFRVGGNRHAEDTPNVAKVKVHFLRSGRVIQIADENRPLVALPHLLGIGQKAAGQWAGLVGLSQDHVHHLEVPFVLFPSR
eukprot:maker-scaffold776_size99073-snap-gene-0.23 protein:Tk00566 transcript:maker-scaffold776_size99073-snap-gene-0.23-mRNA-1 annotation:"solute carrier family 41 member 2"